MNKLDKKLVLIGIRKKGERRFKIQTITEIKGESPRITNTGKSLGLRLTRQ